MLEKTIEKNSENEFVSVHDVEPGDYVRIGWGWETILKIKYEECGRYDVYTKKFLFIKNKYSCFDIRVRGFKKEKKEKKEKLHK